MSMIVISGPANVFAESPRSHKAISDGRVLARFHGLSSELTCAETFDEAPLMDLGITGGHLRFLFDPAAQRLRITAAYYVPGRLTGAELQLLIDATKVQWSDGIGNGSFDYFRGTIYSTSFAIALLNMDPNVTNIGRFFVDAYPLDAEDEETRAQFFEDHLTEKADFDYLRESAEFGDSEAMGLLGDAFENGEGVPMDLAQAVGWYRRGAECDNAPCQAQLGECFEMGRGVEVNPGEALRWYEMALANGLTAVQPAIDRVRAAAS